MNTKSKLIFALAGEVVSKSAHAKRILVDTISVGQVAQMGKET